MRSPALRVAFALLLVAAIALSSSFAQSKRTNQKPQPTAPPQPQPTQTPLEEPEEMEILKTDTDLVTVPVTATDRNGTYITDLRQEEFTITENGVRQEVAFFGKVAAPFHVVLLLDTSSSTREKLREIQQAAAVFVDQLQPADRVKVISFDDTVKDLNEFTSNRSMLRDAIFKTKSGDGTKIYDAIEVALGAIRKIRSRKAIVVFSDGVDWYSDRASFDGTLRWLDEEGVVVYPIRYETRATTEAIAREQASGGAAHLPTIGVINQPPPSGRTAPTFPSESTIPTTSQRTGPFGLPLPEDIMRRRREEEMRRQPDRAPSGDPTEIPPDRGRDPSVPRVPGSTSPAPGGGPNTPTTTTKPSPYPDDSIKKMLDMAYLKADSYLQQLAEKSGGRLLRADTLGSLPDAFAQIAAELRTQYMLGYYPLNKERDETYRTIKVTTGRSNVTVRSRPGYLATTAR